MFCLCAIRDTRALVKHGSLVQSGTDKIHSDISPILPLNFTGGLKSAKFDVDFDINGI